MEVRVSVSVELSFDSTPVLTGGRLPTCVVLE